MSRPLAPAGGDERVYTPEPLAIAIVKHFNPTGLVLDPCRGKGAFSNNIAGCFWCEIDGGKDFFDWKTPVDWIITNPPWGKKFLSFLQHSMTLAHDIVFLANMNVWLTKCRREELRAKGFGIVEMLEVDTPPPPWPQQGFQLAATWIRRGWTGGIHLHRPETFDEEGFWG